MNHPVDSTVGEESLRLDVDGVFVAVWNHAGYKFVKDLVELDASGYIVAGEDGKTSVSGIYAAGDIRTKPLRQDYSAAADGANCITSVEGYLLTM